MDNSIHLNSERIKTKTNFTHVNNKILLDPTISLKAKGLYILIQNFLSANDFVLYKKNLKKYLMEGNKAFESIWKELKNSAYLKKYSIKDQETKQIYYEYELLEKPNFDLLPQLNFSKENHNTEIKKIIKMYSQKRYHKIRIYQSNVN